MKSYGVTFENDLIKAIYLDDVESAKKAIKKISKSESSIFGLDIETAKAVGYEDNYLLAGLSPQLSTIRLLQIYDPDSTICYLFDMWNVQKELLLEFQTLLQKKRFVAHNAQFDMKHLAYNKMPIKDCDCTIILSNLVYHAREFSVGMIPSTLQNLVEKEFKVSVPKHLQASNWNREKLTEDQLKYAALDGYLTTRLAKIFIPKIVELGMEKIYALNKKTLHIVAKMELAGVRMDRKAHAEMIYAWEKERFECEKILEVSMSGVNPRSSKQMTEWLTKNLTENQLALWPKTDSGKALSTDSDTLQEFAHLEFVKPLADYKYYDKLCTTYGRSLYERRNPVTKRIHGGFTLARTHTGRMSGRDPNLQNQPARNKGKSFKELFIPAPGNIFICADYSQIEMRVMAEISQDTRMRQIYKKQLDLYKIFAAAIRHKKVSEVTKEERQAAKAIVLGMQFGMGAAKLAVHAGKPPYNVQMTEEEAKEYVEMFHALFPEYAAWKKRHTQRCEKLLRVCTPLGKIHKLHKDAYYTNSLNTPIQGGAAEIMLYALNFIDAAFEKEGVIGQIILPVHDETVSEVRNTPQNVELASAIVKREMIAAAKKVFPKIFTEGLVELKTGMSWAEAK
jgi:DNA polymerase-1